MLKKKNYIQIQTDKCIKIGEKLMRDGQKRNKYTYVYRFN